MLDARPDSPANTFRVNRFRLLKSVIDGQIASSGSCRVLDLGGTASYWETFGRDIDWTKVRVSLLNLTATPVSSPSMESLVGDARHVDAFEDNSFDVVFSNSVIEHVGRWSDMVAMANEVRRLAPVYLVQTPYFWFPLEPHARFPFLHWLPESLRYRIVMQRACGSWQRQEDVGAATERIQSVVLLDKHQMKHLFPDATILSERVFGLTKSLTAARYAR
jgi:hypothetical protein